MRLRALVPPPLKRVLRRAHQDFAFKRGVRKLTRDPMGVSDDTLRGLVYGWGNSGFSAEPEYLRAIIHTARTLDGPGDILECGSGLSTLVLAMMAKDRQVVALEHVPAWATRVRSALADLGLSDRATVLDAPLKSYGDYAWYSAPANRRFALVVCDGPPSTTAGGRYGLLPIMREQLLPGCVVLLDDLGRPDEQAILARWTSEVGGQSSVHGTEKPYGTLRLPA